MHAGKSGAVIPDNWSSRGKGRPPGAKQDRTEVEGAALAVGWAHLTSSGGGLFLHLVLLVDAIVAWVRIVGTSKSYLYE